MSRGIESIKRTKEKKNITLSIGYCFIIVLVVLLVMSYNLTGTYTQVLQSERADSMEMLVTSSSGVLGHTPIYEGMTYPLPLYEYAPDKPYIVEIYTKGGNSFQRLYSSLEKEQTEPYYLSGVGDTYNDCFEKQQTSFTKRTDNGITYVAAIAPIISQDNTVAGILEIRMPYSDYVSTVNGMSLSWIFTIFSIAVALGIFVFELNLFVSTISRGFSSNVPVLVMYGKDAIRFLTFFVSFGAVMEPLIITEYLTSEITNLPYPLKVALACLSMVLYVIGFFGFTSLRKTIKNLLTERIGLLFMTALGTFLSVVVGLLNIPFLFIPMMLPVSFCYSFAFDSLRDYRINSGRLGIKGYEDRTIHNIQISSYFFGAIVGAVLSGILIERFGFIIVSLASGLILILSALGLNYFFRGNNTVKESILPINKWLEFINDKYAGKFILSTFVLLGVVLSFMLCFIPSYLPTVGISVATSSFYYLVAAFSACFVCAIIKIKYQALLTSKLRVVLSSFSIVIGLASFAIYPSAKMLLVSAIILGISLGIHDYYYLYVLSLLSASRIKANLRRVAELSLLIGFVVSIPFFLTGIAINKLRIVFLIISFIIFVLSILYPMSSYSNDIDSNISGSRNNTSKKTSSKNKKAKTENSAIHPDMNNQVVNDNQNNYEYPMGEMPVVTDEYVTNAYNESIYNENVYNAFGAPEGNDYLGGEGNGYVE